MYSFFNHTVPRVRREVGILSSRLRAYCRFPHPNPASKLVLLNLSSLPFSAFMTWISAPATSQADDSLCGPFHQQSPGSSRVALPSCSQLEAVIPARGLFQMSFPPLLGGFIPFSYVGAFLGVPFGLGTCGCHSPWGGPQLCASTPALRRDPGSAPPLSGGAQ